MATIYLLFLSDKIIQLKRTFEFTKTFRCYIHGDLEKAEVLLYVLHGYGQLATYFIKKFAGLKESIAVIAPEGMHRFYLNGSSGRVGASWMTKEDREDDIKDNMQWLNQLDASICEGKIFKKKIVLGFSQGAATAARWHQNNINTFDELIMWASVFPPDLSIQKEVTFKLNTNYFLLGAHDEYFDEAARVRTIQHYRSMNFDVITYEGIHDICQQTLSKLLNQLVE